MILFTLVKDRNKQHWKVSSPLMSRNACNSKSDKNHQRAVISRMWQTFKLDAKSGPLETPT